MKISLVENISLVNIPVYDVGSDEGYTLSLDISVDRPIELDIPDIHPSIFLMM